MFDFLDKHIFLRCKKKLTASCFEKAKKKDNEERVNASPLELCLIPLILPLKLNNIADNFANTLIIEAEAV